GTEKCNPRCESCMGSGKITPQQQQEMHDKYTMKGEPVSEALLGFRMVTALIVLNVLGYGAQEMIGPGFTNSFVYHGPRIQITGEWWRMLTACFLHANLMHLGFNM